MRIRPTELGLKGMLLLAALEVAFLATSYSNLFFLLIAFCCVLGGLGAWWACRNVRTVHVHIGDVPLAAAGAARPLRLHVLGGRKVRFDLAIEVAVRGQVFELAHTPLLIGDCALQASLPGLPRGVHAVQRLSLVSRFPFGFFRVRRDLRTATEIVTYPAPDAPATAQQQIRAFTGPLATSGKCSSTVAGLRAFRGGDAMADVHWRASARRGTPIVKEREHEAGNGIEVVLDRRCTEQQLESALSTTTNLLLAVTRRERALRITSQDFAVHIGSDRNDETALRWLAAATTLPHSAANPPAGSRGSLRLPAARSLESGDA
ncbi:MAG: DUF58 domain-containing protein [Planctomycetota bacterium]